MVIVRVFGKNIGTAEDMDMSGWTFYIYYKFKAVDPAFMWADEQDLYVDIEEGTFSVEEPEQTFKAEWKI